MKTTVISGMFPRSFLTVRELEKCLTTFWYFCVGPNKYNGWIPDSIILKEYLLKTTGIVSHLIHLSPTAFHITSLSKNAWIQSIISFMFYFSFLNGWITSIWFAKPFIHLYVSYSLHDKHAWSKKKSWCFSNAHVPSCGI